MLIRLLAFALVISSLLVSQETRAQSPAAGQDAPGAATTQAPAQQPTSPGNDDLAQIRIDLSHMESLNNNMSSEIEFLHDQNLQILLRTNAQMWTILIRDLRQQVDREQRRRTIPPKRDENGAPAVKPH